MLLAVASVGFTDDGLSGDAVVMQIKPGVRLHGICPEIVLALFIVSEIINRVSEKSARITSGIEGGHSRASLHYTGDAVDIGSKEFSIEIKNEILAQCRAALGDDYDMILESVGQTQEHFHLEFQPKSKYV